MATREAHVKWAGNRVSVDERGEATGNVMAYIRKIRAV